MAQQEEEIQLWQTVKPAEFVPHVDDRSEAQALLISTRQGVGYQIAAGQLAHAIESRSSHILMDYSQNACSIRYQVDGNWEQLPPLDRESGDAMLYAIKQLCLMNPTDRRSAQTGKVTLKIGKDKFGLTIQSQGVASGERVLGRIEPDKLPFSRLADLGVRDKMIEVFKEKLDTEGNIILVSAPKSEGLTTTWNVVLNAADRLVRDFQSFEEQGHEEPEVININPCLFGGDTELTLLERLRKAILKEPDVLIFPELPDAESLSIALDQVENTSKQVYTRIVASGTLEALTQFMAHYPDSADSITKLIGAVVTQKLVRRLCDNCKVGYEPPPQLLKQLGIPPGRVAMLYQPFIPPPIEEQVDENGRPAPITPCHICGGRGYYGRIGIFELLTPGEQLREALGKTRDVNQLMQIAKSEGHRVLQNEAVLTVARGLTSLDELKRVFARR